MSYTSFLDPVLGPLMSIPAPWNVFLLSFVLTLGMTLLYKYATDQKLMKELKDEMKELQKEMKMLKDEPAKMMEVQKRAMERNMKYLLQSLKPTIISLIPIFLILGWMRTYFIALENPVILFGLSWLWIYIISSIIFSLGLRKLLKVH